ncbi:MAG: SUMF1/EgtB/PvdO family nonheme iron enzyme [Treponema sp.]
MKHCSIIILVCIMLSSLCSSCNAVHRKVHPLVSPVAGTLIYVPTGYYRRSSRFFDISIVRRPFYMSEYEITYDEFFDVTGMKLTDNTSGRYPVKFVNWYQAVIFCNMLSEKENLKPVYSINGCTDPGIWIKKIGGFIPTGHADPYLNAVKTDWTADGYRLPTELEWIWAARGADSSKTDDEIPFSGFDGTGSLGDYAWFKGNSFSTSHETGLKKPNKLGLFDMSGNVFEWCWDWFGDTPHGIITSVSHRGTGCSRGVARVIKGGGWRDIPSEFVLSYRCGSFPYDRDHYVGFRIVRNGA